MSARVQILAITASLVLILLVVSLIRGRKLREEYSILWLLASLTLIVFSVWRTLLDHVARLIGVLYAPAVLLLVGIFFGVLAFLHLTVVISRHADQNRVMAQEIALLREKLESQEKDRAGTASDD